jgi:hypothetical protein
MKKHRLMPLLTSNSWSGVVRGAVLRACGVGMSPPEPSKASPKHYGFSISESYADYKHVGAPTMKNKVTGQRVASNQLSWIIRKGDLILPGQPLRQTFVMNCTFETSKVQGNESVRLTFVGANMDEPPATLQGLPPGKSSFVW